MQFCVPILPANPTSDEWLARARAQYLDPNQALARVMQEPTDRQRLSRARYMLSFVRNPQARFGLSASMIPATVIAVLLQIERELGPTQDAAVRKLALRLQKLERAGFAQDEIWNLLEDEARPLGFRYGDSTYLRDVLLEQ